MTDPDGADVRHVSLAEWIADHRDNYDAVVEVTGAPFGDAERDPMTVIPYLQRYLDQMPLDEFEKSDWITLQNDCVSFLARFMAVSRGATWAARPTPDTPYGYRYVLVTTDAQGVVHFVDPYLVVALEFQDPDEIDVVHMIATVEATLESPANAW